MYILLSDFTNWMEKLETQFKSISDIFNQQQRKLESEIAEKDKLLSESTNRIISLEHDNDQLQSTISELQRKLIISETESRTSQQSFHSLSVRYQKLKNVAGQLEAFRKVFLVD